MIIAQALTGFGGRCPEFSFCSHLAHTTPENTTLCLNHRAPMNSYTTDFTAVVTCTADRLVHSSQFHLIPNQALTAVLWWEQQLE